MKVETFIKIYHGPREKESKVYRSTAHTLRVRDYSGRKVLCKREIPKKPLEDIDHRMQIPKYCVMKGRTSFEWFWILIY